MHRISDPRFTGMSVRNFRMFRHLCGDSTLKNVVLVTNMWGKDTLEVCEARERELADKHFKTALDKGAQFVRHDHTTQSSHDIIRRIMKNVPTAFQIQREIVDEGKSIDNTAAGEAVGEEINRLIKRHEAEAKTLREEMRRALEIRDEETRIELEEATRELKEQMEKMKTESEAMVSRFNKEKRRVDEVITQMNKTQERDPTPTFNEWLAQMAWQWARIYHQANRFVVSSFKPASTSGDTTGTGDGNR